MTFPTNALVGSDTVDGLMTKVNSHFGDASQHGGGGSGIISVATVAALENLTGVADGEYRYLSGYWAAGDGGGGRMVRRVQGSGATRDGGSVFTSADGGKWISEAMNPVSVLYFGAKGDDTADDGPPIQAALDCALASGKSLVIVPPGAVGTYWIASGSLTITNPVKLRGLSERTTLSWVQNDLGAGNYAVTLKDSGGTDSNRAGIENITVYGPGGGQVVVYGTAPADMHGVKLGGTYGTYDKNRALIRNLHVHRALH
jgi:hypothetical protein